MLPVVECGDSNNVGNCNRFVGVVKVSLLWMNRDSDPQMNWVPVKMAAAGDKGPWTATYQNTENKDVGLRQANFDDFINHFNLKNVNDLTATHQKKALYFLPNCDVDVSVGGTGGENYGIRAKNPVLVH